jgi:hypothetical protein
MPNVDFSQYSYYPNLICSAGEHMGYVKLSDQDKSAILPIFELSNTRNACNFTGAINRIKQTVGSRNFILDLSHEPAPQPFISSTPTQDQIDRYAEEMSFQGQYNAGLAKLLSPTDGFLEWRLVASQFPNAIPVLQFSDPQAEARSILRQASFFSKLGTCMAIRVRSDSVPSIYPVIGQVLSILDSPDKLLLIVDCDQGRQYLQSRSAFAMSFMMMVYSELELPHRPFLRAVVLSNSFTSPQHEKLELYKSFDWRLWNLCRAVFPFSIGDYAAMFRRKRQNTYVPSDSRPTVVFPLDDAWLVYRDDNLNDLAGWVRGAKAVSDDPRFVPTPLTWGAQEIVRASHGDTILLDSSRYWNAVKVNIHIHRQIRYAPFIMNSYGIGDETE